MPNLNISDPDGQCMDDMNELNQKRIKEAELFKEALRIADDFDVFRPLATRDHVKVLLLRIRQVEQSLLREVNENQEPF